ncbi:Thioredoxin domain-containing protein [Psidium guajava]|nr:Thioredoxin domain-containing protein [Psidium guajava]
MEGMSSFWRSVHRKEQAIGNSAVWCSRLLKSSRKSPISYPLLQHLSLAVNVQTNVEYKVSYAYHAMYAHFDRDTVALKGLARFFKDSSEGGRGHAGQVVPCCHILFIPFLHSSGFFILTRAVKPSISVAEQNHDVELMDFIDSRFSTEQVGSIKKISEYVADLRKSGQRHVGVRNFDPIFVSKIFPNPRLSHSLYLSLCPFSLSPLFSHNDDTAASPRLASHRRGLVLGSRRLA